MTRAIHYSYLSALRWGRYKTPHNHRSRPQTITNTCRSSFAAPSRLGGDNHQKKQEIRSHNDLQVPLDAITRANTLGITLNLTMMMNQ
jgi:hypothetical protein